MRIGGLGRDHHVPEANGEFREDRTGQSYRQRLDRQHVVPESQSLDVFVSGVSRTPETRGEREDRRPKHGFVGDERQICWRDRAIGEERHECVHGVLAMTRTFWGLGVVDELMDGGTPRGVVANRFSELNGFDELIQVLMERERLRGGCESGGRAGQRGSLVGYY